MFCCDNDTETATPADPGVTIRVTGVSGVDWAGSALIMGAAMTLMVLPRRWRPDDHCAKIVIHSVRQFPWKQPLLGDWALPRSLSQDTLLPFSVDRSSFPWLRWHGQFRILLKAAPTSALRTVGRVAFTN